MTTFVSYFDNDTGYSEREVQSSTTLIKKVFVHVSNLQVVIINESFRKFIKVLDTNYHPADLIYSIFCSIVSAKAEKYRALIDILSLKFTTLTSGSCFFLSYL